MILRRARIARPARGVYCCRDRELRADLQRWMQKDPNGTGQVVLSGARKHGTVLRPLHSSVSPMAMFENGASLHQYVGGKPTVNRDPLGLFFSLGDVMGASSWQAELQENSAQTHAEIFQDARTRLRAFFDRIAIHDMVDSLWASDWDAADDDYSRAANMESGPSHGGSRGAGRGIRPAAVWSPEDASKIRALARASNHGAAKHYQAMADMTIEFMKKNNLGLKDVEVHFNRCVRDRDGKVIHFADGTKARADVVVRQGNRNLLVGEVANSQSPRALMERTDRWGRAVPGVAIGERDLRAPRAMSVFSPRKRK